MLSKELCRGISVYPMCDCPQIKSMKMTDHEDALNIKGLQKTLPSQYIVELSSSKGSHIGGSFEVAQHKTNFAYHILERLSLIPQNQKTNIDLIMLSKRDILLGMFGKCIWKYWCWKMPLANSWPCNTLQIDGRTHKLNCQICVDHSDIYQLLLV